MLQAVTVAEGLPAFVAGAAGAPGLAGNPPAWRPGQALLDPDGDLCGAGGYPKAMKVGYRLRAMGDKSAEICCWRHPHVPFPRASIFPPSLALNVRPTWPNNVGGSLEAGAARGERINTRGREGGPRGLGLVVARAGPFSPFPTPIDGPHPAIRTCPRARARGD